MIAIYANTKMHNMLWMDDGRRFLHTSLHNAHRVCRFYHSRIGHVCVSVRGRHKCKRCSLSPINPLCSPSSVISFPHNAFYSRHITIRYLRPSLQQCVAFAIFHDHNCRPATRKCIRWWHEAYHSTDLFIHTNHQSSGWGHVLAVHTQAHTWQRLLRVIKQWHSFSIHQPCNGTLSPVRQRIMAEWAVTDILSF